jgi:hypothetical protein
MLQGAKLIAEGAVEDLGRRIARRSMMKNSFLVEF